MHTKMINLLIPLCSLAVVAGGGGGGLLVANPRHDHQSNIYIPRCFYRLFAHDARILYSEC